MSLEDLSEGGRRLATLGPRNEPAGSGKGPAGRKEDASENIPVPVTIEAGGGLEVTGILKALSLSDGLIVQTANPLPFRTSVLIAISTDPTKEAKNFLGKVIRSEGDLMTVL